MKRSRSITTIVTCVAVVAVAATFFGATSSGGSSGQEQTEEIKRIYVETGSATVGDLAVTGEYIGKIEPNQQVMVIPRTSGEALAVNVNVGDRVEAGDLLVELDDTDASLQVALARASVASAQASANQTMGGTMGAQVLQAETGYQNAQNSYASAIDLLSKTNRSYDQQLQDLDDVLDQLSNAKSETKRQADNLRYSLAAKQKELNDLIAQLQLGVSSGLQARIEILRTEITMLTQSLATAESAYEQAKSSYDSTAKSYDQLELGSEIDLRSLRTQLDAARISTESAEKSLSLIDNATIPQTQDVVDAAVGQAQAQLNITARQLDFTKITAPIGGVIEQRSIDPHGMVSPQSPVFVISNKDLITVSFNVSEYVVGNLNVGETVTLEKNGATCTATIVEISSMVDQQSGLFKVKVTVENPPFPMLTGSNVKIFADTEKAESGLIIPIDAVYYDEGAPYVYILENGIARKTVIETGISSGDSIQVLSGIGADAQIITTWNANLKDGAEVEIAGEASASETEAPSEE